MPRPTLVDRYLGELQDLQESLAQLEQQYTKAMDVQPGKNKAWPSVEQFLKERESARVINREIQLVKTRIASKEDQVERAIQFYRGME